MNKYSGWPKRLKLSKIFHPKFITTVVVVIIFSVLTFSLVFISRAQASTLYERYTCCFVDWRRTCQTVWNAQTFTVGNTGANEDFTITSVKLLLSRVNLPGTLTVSIRATDANEKPTGPDLTSGTVDSNSFTTDTHGAWYEIDLTPYKLSASTQYAIVIRALNGICYTVKVHWINDWSGTYAGGAWLYSTNSGVNWNGPYAGQDFLFQVYGTPLATITDFSLPNYSLYLEDGTDVTVNGQSGTHKVLLKSTTSAVRISDFNVDFDNLTSWSDIEADTAYIQGKSFIHGLAGHAEVTNKVLYVPAPNTTNNFYICPDAATLDEVSPSCPNIIANLSLGSTSGDISVASEYATFNGNNYYKVSGITGSGGEEAGDEDEAVPEFTTVTLIIAAVAGFGIYFVIRQRKEKKTKV